MGALAPRSAMRAGRTAGSIDNTAARRKTFELTAFKLTAFKLTNARDKLSGERHRPGRIDKAQLHIGLAAPVIGAERASQMQRFAARLLQRLA